MEFTEIRAKFGHRFAMLLKWPVISKDEKFLETITLEQWRSFLSQVDDKDVEKEILERMSKIAKSYKDWKMIFIRSQLFSEIKLQATDKMLEMADNFDNLIFLAIEVKSSSNRLTKVIDKAEFYADTFEKQIRLYGACSDLYDHESRIRQSKYTQLLYKSAKTVRDVIVLLSRVGNNYDHNEIMRILNSVDTEQCQSEKQNPDKPSIQNFGLWKKLFNECSHIPEVAHLAAQKMLETAYIANHYIAIHKSNAHYLLNKEDIKAKIGNTQSFEFWLLLCNESCEDLLPQNFLAEKLVETASSILDLKSIITNIKSWHIRQKAFEIFCKKELNVGDWIYIYCSSINLDSTFSKYTDIAFEKIDQFKLSISEWKLLSSQYPPANVICLAKMREIANN